MRNLNKFSLMRERFRNASPLRPPCAANDDDPPEPPPAASARVPRLPPACDACATRIRASAA